jgi:ParB family chromosome partitioning protein
MPRKPELPEVSFDEEEEDVSGLFNELSGLPTAQVGQQRTVEMIPVDLIDPSPYQSRKNFSSKEIEEFADVMREEGFTSTIWVRPSPTKPGRYELLFGERRWRAASLVARDDKPKFTVIPCEIRTDYNDPDRIRFLGFFENKQRVNLSPSEEALYYQSLLDLKGPDGKQVYTYEKLSKRAKVPESHIQDCLYLLTLPQDVREAYDRNPSIALRSLREVCRISSPEERRPLLDLLVHGNFSVKALRAVVLDMLQDEDGEVQPAPSALEEASLSSNGTQIAPTPLAIREDNKDSAAILQQEESTPLGEGVSPVEQKDATESAKPTTTSLRTIRAVIRRDTNTIADILARWRSMAEKGDEIYVLIQEGVKEVYELSKPFLPQAEGEELVSER